MRKVSICLLGAVLLTACGPSGESPGYETRQQYFERICGPDKYQGPQGVDVSVYQQNFDWAARKAEGIQFGVARVSNGTQIIDEYFDRNWSEMKAKGIYRGAYQYFRPGQDAAAQANIMVNKLGRLGPGDMPAVIDVETTDGESAATVRAKVREWLQIVEAGTGKKPMIYTAAYFWRDNVGDTGLSDYPLWIANYGADCPLVPDGWSKWTFWQYCDGNPDYCSNGAGFDRNVFNGTAEDLEAFAGAGGYGAGFVSQSFPLASMPFEMEAGETVSGYIELENTGALPWNDQTRLATTEPRDRDSAFADETWLAPNRPAAVSGTVAPGESHRFEFNLRAPAEPGTYMEYFGVVQEGTTWFSDQQGPPDDQLQIAVTVVEGPAVHPDPMPENPTDPGVPEGPTVPGAGGDSDGPGTDVPGMQAGESDDLPPLLGPSPGTEGGCSQAPGEPTVPPALLVLALFGLRRRRRVR